MDLSVELLYIWVPRYINRDSLMYFIPLLTIMLRRVVWSLYAV